MAVLQQVLDLLGLTLNPEKTQVVDARQSSFDFLGFEIHVARSRRTGRRYPNVQPSKKALQTIKSRVTQMTRRELTCVPLETVVGTVNQTLRGWVGYFHYRNCSRALAKVKLHAEQRLRTHLRRRHKIRHRVCGYGRFPDRSLYEHHGLYKVPTTAGWKKAHA